MGFPSRDFPLRLRFDRCHHRRLRVRECRLQRLDGDPESFDQRYGVPPDHHRHEAVFIYFVYLARADVLPITQHRHAIGNRENYKEYMEKTKYRLFPKIW